MRLTEIPVSGFDEQRYLKANPDVKAAIDAGITRSALFHFRRYGRYERRPGLPSDARRYEYTPLMPMPPAPLRTRVHGTPDIETFELVGRAVCDDILDAAAAFGIHLTPEMTVLDFGCGCGRVIRHLVPQCSARVEGTDIDHEAIDWAANNLEGVTFCRNSEWPPLPFEDNRFDLVYCISVFTHLPEDMQYAWLEELRRVAKPGAHLLLSVHSPELMPPDDLTAAQAMSERGFCYLRLDATDGLPDFYRTAYHGESYIANEWGKFFDVKALIAKGIGDYQDLVVARNPP